MRGGDRKSNQSARVHFDSAADRAAVAGVSLRTQKKADKITKLSPEKAAEVARGEKTLNEAIKDRCPSARIKRLRKNRNPQLVIYRQNTR